MEAPLVQTRDGDSTLHDRTGHHRRPALCRRIHRRPFQPQVCPSRSGDWTCELGHPLPLRRDPRRGDRSPERQGRALRGAPQGTADIRPKEVRYLNADTGLKVASVQGSVWCPNDRSRIAPSYGDARFERHARDRRRVVLRRGGRIVREHLRRGPDADRLKQWMGLRRPSTVPSPMRIALVHPGTTRGFLASHGDLAHTLTCVGPSSVSPST